MADVTSGAVAVGSPVSQATYLKDYRPPNFFIDRTDLEFDLFKDKTTVNAHLTLRRNTAVNDAPELILAGENLHLVSVAINGVIQPDDNYQVNHQQLVISSPPDQFTLSIVTEIDPANNLSLEGLYLSDGMYCTQCEAQGFRRITYYLDRPDVLSIFTTKITADLDQYPVLLSNGNLDGQGREDGGRHWVKWSDPFKKPAYLFALVAGDLEVVEDSFVTVSGRQVALKIYVESKDLDKCDHAMLSLKRAMQWDEEVYGREYDLDLYMIVAVDFFNMGAMENKGLNIFNTSCVLANPLTQTDMAFQRVEAVVAHEYFHNWSGNRVTCRDWFQLSLKEGFTVFRDASFSADMNSATVKRVEDVSLLRSAQFAEDGGPMSHPIRPESYIEISNFYTLTVYEKGAEVIRMMHQFLGADKFRAGSDLYFDRHDGEAATCEDFIVAMEDASGYDLAQFRRWYSQAGTPVLDAQGSWDQQSGCYTLTIQQSCPATPGQAEKLPFSMPIKVALVSKSGLLTASCDSSSAQLLDGDEFLLSLTESEQQWQFTGLSEKPVASLLRGFSAPVKLNFQYQPQELLQLLEADNDGFIRWDASQRYALQLVHAHLTGEQTIDSLAGQQAVKALGFSLSQLLAQGLRDKGWDPACDAALTAEIIRLPSYAYLIEQFDSVDIHSIIKALECLQMSLSDQLKSVMLDCYQQLRQQLEALGGYQPLADHVALRSLKNTCLAFLMRSNDPSLLHLAETQFDLANNMTDQSSALSALVNCPLTDAEAAAQQRVDRFYQQWSSESLVVNQWLTVQAASDKPGALGRVRALMDHEAYDNTNPNKVRALIGGFCMRNIKQFHAQDGSGYQLLSEEVIRLNTLNPQLDSRLLSPLTQWRRFKPPQSELMQASLQCIADTENLSADVFEVVTKSLVAS